MPGRLVFSTTADGAASPTERMRIDSAGRVGIGTSSPNAKLYIAEASSNTGGDINLNADGLVVDNSGGNTGLTFKTPNTASSRIAFGDPEDNNAGQILYSQASNYFAFDTAGSERMRIDSSGRVLIGTTSSLLTYGANLSLQVAGTGFSSSSILLRRDSNDNNPPAVVFGKSRGSAGGNTVVQANDQVGALVFAAADGTDLTSVAGEIKVQIDGTPGSNDTPGRIVFGTTADGATGVTERMRIDSSGRVGINETALSSFNSIGDDLVISQASGSAGITIRSGTSNTGVLAFTDGANTSFRGDVRYDHNGDYMRFSTNGNERLRIDSSGNVGIGTTSPASDLHIASSLATIRLEDSDVAGGASYSLITSSSNANIELSADPDNVRSSSDIRFKVDGTERMRLNSTNLNMISAYIDFSGSISTPSTAASIFRPADNTLAFGTANNERMRVASNGDVYVARTTDMDLGANNVTGICLLASGRVKAARNGSAALQIGRQQSNGEVALFACQGTAIVGSISVTTSATAFNTSHSDRTLKKNFENWTENTLELFKNINPQKFNFTDEEDTDPKHKGYVAQDLIDSFPEAYNKNDNDKYMFNPSGMVVYLMKAIQELQAEVAALKAA